jgi:uncharacterized membrane protein YgdD (TMEM256/DUF423 family)
MNSTLPFRIAAIVGFLGVALGAFGAHSFHDVLVRNERVATWETAVLYHLVHAAVLVAITLREPVGKIAWLLFTVGIVIFSGTLYALGLTNLRWLGAITPLGGLCLMAGWLMLAIRPRS